MRAPPPPSRCSSSRLGAADRALVATVLDDPQCLELAVRICRAVDGVPLAMEFAAARARAFTLDEIAEQVGTDASALARIGRGRPEHRKADHHRTVRFAVEQSYRVLPADEAALYRAVSVVPGPFTPPLAAALAALPVGDTHELLARLVHRSLLVSLVRPARDGPPGSRSWRRSAGTPPTPPHRIRWPTPTR